MKSPWAQEGFSGTVRRPGLPRAAEGKPADGGAAWRRQWGERCGLSHEEGAGKSTGYDRGLRGEHRLRQRPPGSAQATPEGRVSTLNSDGGGLEGGSAKRGRADGTKGAAPVVGTKRERAPVLRPPRTGGVGRSLLDRRGTAPAPKPRGPRRGRQRERARRGREGAQTWGWPQAWGDAAGKGGRRPTCEKQGEKAPTTFALKWEKATRGDDTWTSGVWRRTGKRDGEKAPNRPLSPPLVGHKEPILGGRMGQPVPLISKPLPIQTPQKS